MTLAGVLGHLVHPEKVEPELWREVMSVNLEGAYACAQAAYPYLKKNKYGKVRRAEAPWAMMPVPTEPADKVCQR